MRICTELPATNEDTRNQIYQGEVFRVAANQASNRLVQMAYSVLYEALGAAPRQAEREWPKSDFFTAMGHARREIYTSHRFHRAVRDCIVSLGFDNSVVAFDPARLRIINHNGHLDPLAAAVYYPHRDIWYGHPNSLITWWIPLDDLSAEETFCFYPECFDQPVPNSSAIFDYDEWVSKGWDLKIGWQKVSAEHRSQYPALTADIDRGKAVGFNCSRGDNLLFSGAHFHATRPHSQHRTRFSLDFRIVDVRDWKAKRGAPCVDNYSTGSAVVDYIQAGEDQWRSVPL